MSLKDENTLLQSQLQALTLELQKTKKAAADEAAYWFTMADAHLKQLEQLRENRRLKKIVIKVIRRTRALLKAFLIRRLARYPRVKAKLIQLKRRLRRKPMVMPVCHVEDLSPNASRIHAQLLQCIKEKESIHAHSD